MIYFDVVNDCKLQTVALISFFVCKFKNDGLVKSRKTDGKVKSSPLSAGFPLRFNKLFEARESCIIPCTTVQR